MIIVATVAFVVCAFFTWKFFKSLSNDKDNVPGSHPE